MAINYKVSKCKNPKEVEGTDYYSNKARRPATTRPRERNEGAHSDMHTLAFAIYTQEHP